MRLCDGLALHVSRIVAAAAGERDDVIDDVARPAEVHHVVRRDIATDDARRVSATLNRDLVKPLIDLNRGPRRRYPQISIVFNEKADLSELMVGLGAAIDRGLRFPEKWLRDQFGVPDLVEGEALLHPGERIAAQSAPDSTPASAISGVPMGGEFTDVASSFAHKRRATNQN